MLSAMARLVRARAFESSNTGVMGPRSSARQPAMKGFARGHMGVMGSSPLRTRDSDAGWKSDVEFMRGPLFKAYMSKLGKY